MKISPKFMKNADPQDVVIVLGVYVLIIFEEKERNEN
nr:MAG TPA: hypothetical protein [Caudoviricetes sp.]